MTIAIGFKCTNGIVVATDRRYSYSTSASSLREDGEKITSIEFKNGYAVVAEAGDVSMSTQFVDMFEQMAADIEITSKRTVPATATEAMRAIKRDLCAFNGWTMDQLDEKFAREGTRAQCIIASIYKDEKSLHTITLSKATADKVKTPYITIGSGAALAEYLLATHYDPKKDDWFSGVLATYVIEQVKKHDLNCGGRPNVMSLFVEGSAHAQTQNTGDIKPEVVDQYIAAINSIEAERSESLQKGFATAILDSLLGRGSLELPIQKKKKR